MKLFSLIAAVCKTAKKEVEGGLGVFNDLPWTMIKEDMRFFKSVTSSHQNNVVIMGRKTWESIPEKHRPLPNRINVVLSSSQTFENALSFKTLDSAMEHLETIDTNEIFICGGESLYNQTINDERCKRIYLTKVFNEYKCDRFFPVIDYSNYNQIFKSSIHNQNEIKYQFIGLSKDSEDKTMMETSTFVNPVNNEESQYLNLLTDILENGKVRSDRTGTGTVSVFGRQLRFSLRDHIPVLTTKRVYWRGVVEELIWFLRADTNVKNLNDKKVRIWDGNSTREYLDNLGLQEREEKDAGPIYGFQWRPFNAEYKTCHDDYSGQGYDQVAECLRLIREQPESRRIIISGWNPLALKEMCLPPCHVMYQFYVNDGELSCHMYQRSADVFLGLPFNITSTALLTCILANMTGLKRGDIIISTGDTHIYSNHIKQCRTQLSRVPRAFPELKINKKIENERKLNYDDFELVGYNPCPTIKAEMAV